MYPTPENVFARELMTILQVHDATLNDLTQPPCRIHPMTLYRLQTALDAEQGLGKTFAFPMLSPEDLACITTRYRLAPTEQRRLKAALLTNMVLVKLMARKPSGAVRITEKLFALFVQALEIDEDLAEGIESGAIMDNHFGFHAAYQPILWRFDQGFLAIHVLSADWCDDDERIKAAYEAHRLFHQVILDLYLFSVTEQHTEQWRYLQQTAQQQKEQARNFLLGLGLEP